MNSRISSHDIDNGLELFRWVALVFTLGFLLGIATVKCEPLKVSQTALVVANAMDVATTLNAFSRGCVEADPILKGSPGRVVVGKALSTTVVLLSAGWLDRRGHTRLARAITWFGTGVASVAVVQNLECGR